MTATTRAAPIPMKVRNEMPATARPQMAITTVAPAISTARPAVAMARPAASSTVRTFVQALSVSGDDEQRVVDSHA